MIAVNDINPSAADGPRALVIPGAGYSVQAPLLYWSVEALLEEGFRVHAVEWTFDEAARLDPQAFVDRAVELGLDAMGGLPELVVAKSIGSLSVPRFVAEGVPGIWWTPLLHQREVAAALRSASADHVAIGGTDDDSWRQEELEGSAVAVISVDGGSHSLELPGRGWKASLDSQASLLEDVGAHIRSLRLKGHKA